MGGRKFFAQIKKFFSEDLSEVIGAYFDGEKIFVTRLTENFESVEIEADGSEIEQLAEKISLICRQKNWKASAVGFCLRESDAVTFQTEIDNVPEKEIPELVKSWARAQAGADATSSFAKVGEELWMETLPQSTIDEFCAAFEKFGMNLRALSVMPADLLEKISPFDRTKFISEIVRNKKAPNFLSARSSLADWKKFSFVAAAIFFVVILALSAKLFLDYDATSKQFDAAKISVDEMSEDIALKKILDEDIAALHKLNKISAAQGASPTKFNLLVNLGKIAGGDGRLTKIQIDEKSLEVEGTTNSPDAVKAYLSRMKNFVVQSARLESSAERDDGEIIFLIRATL